MARLQWNYLILRYADGGVGVHKVYYDDPGKPVRHIEPLVMTAETERELREVISRVFVDASKNLSMDDPFTRTRHFVTSQTALPRGCGWDWGSVVLQLARFCASHDGFHWPAIVP